MLFFSVGGKHENVILENNACLQSQKQQDKGKNDKTSKSAPVINTKAIVFTVLILLLLVITLVLFCLDKNAFITVLMVIAYIIKELVK